MRSVPFRMARGAGSEPSAVPEELVWLGPRPSVLDSSPPPAGPQPKQPDHIRVPQLGLVSPRRAPRAVNSRLTDGDLFRLPPQQ